MKEKLTSKQKKFALEFLISGNITDAAKKAGYSERPARQIGSLNLTKPNVVEYMNEILEKTKSEEVATTEEVLEFLTSVVKESIFLMRTSGGFLTLHRAQLFRPEIRSWRFLVTRQEETTWRCRKIC